MALNLPTALGFGELGTPAKPTSDVEDSTAVPRRLEGAALSPIARGAEIDGRESTPTSTGRTARERVAADRSSLHAWAADTLTVEQEEILTNPASYDGQYVRGTAHAMRLLLARDNLRRLTSYESVVAAAKRSESCVVEIPASGRAAVAYYAEHTSAAQTLTAAMTSAQTEWIRRYGGSQHKHRWNATIRTANLVDIGMETEGIAFLFSAVGEAMIRDVDADLSFYAYASRSANQEVSAAQILGIDQERIQVSSTALRVRPTIARAVREQAKVYRGVGNEPADLGSPKK